jgi:hypothetical protein
VITKSGTNDYHGLIYDFERHSFIEANNWFNNRAGLANPSFKRHQFGANAAVRSSRTALSSSAIMRACGRASGYLHFYRADRAAKGR